MSSTYDAHYTLCTRRLPPTLTSPDHTVSLDSTDSNDGGNESDEYTGPGSPTMMIKRFASRRPVRTHAPPKVEEAPPVRQLNHVEKSHKILDRPWLHVPAIISQSHQAFISALVPHLGITDIAIRMSYQFPELFRSAPGPDKGRADMDRVTRIVHDYLRGPWGKEYRITEKEILKYSWGKDMLREFNPAQFTDETARSSSPLPGRTSASMSPDAETSQRQTWSSTNSSTQKVKKPRGRLGRPRRTKKSPKYGRDNKPPPMVLPPRSPNPDLALFRDHEGSTFVYSTMPLCSPWDSASPSLKSPSIDPTDRSYDSDPDIVMKTPEWARDARMGSQKGEMEQEEEN